VSPKCVTNELSGPIIEAIEPEECLGKALLMRVKNIPNYELMGPPDMCYIVKERKGGFMSSAPVRFGYYHHVIGVDTSSTATPSAYI
jgi:Chs5-Arf1p-binding protein BUD7/BCH1